jgi:hypothetical protein
MWHPAIKHLRDPLQIFVAKHPERAAALLRQPRRISIPKRAWRKEMTVLVTVKVGSGLAEGMLLRSSTTFGAKFQATDTKQYTSSFPGALIPALLARGEGQTVTKWELGRLLLYLTLENRYLKGSNITWAQVPYPAAIDDDEEDDDGSPSSSENMGDAAPVDTDRLGQGQANAPC